MTLTRQVLRPPIGYFGGKTLLAPWIVSHFPKHTYYIEPFCGSAAVLFAKLGAPFELINDVDGELVNFFRVLREYPNELVEACFLTPYARDELLAAHMPANAEDVVERARRYWVRSTQPFGARVSYTRSWSISFGQNTWRPRAVRNKLDRLRLAAERLAYVAVENGDALELLRGFGGREDCVIYADPPYVFSSRSSNEERRGGYVHEWGAEDHHRALADVLRSTPATVFLSAYPSALYDELYAGWWRAEKVVPKNTTHQRGRGRVGRATEVLWSNRPFGMPSLFGGAE